MNLKWPDDEIGRKAEEILAATGIALRPDSREGSNWQRDHVRACLLCEAARAWLRENCEGITEKSWGQGQPHFLHVFVSRQKRIVDRTFEGTDSCAVLAEAVVEMAKEGT